MGDPVLDAAPDAMITIDGRGAVVEFNAAAERLFGFGRSDALGRNVADLVIPEPHRAAHAIGVKRVVAGGESRVTGRRVRLPARRSDGREIVVDLSVTRTSETPPRFTAWIREHDADRAADDDRRALLDTVEDSCYVGSWEWTPSESRLLWSDSVYRILGLRPGEVEPDPKVILALAHPGDRDRVRSRQQHMRATGLLSSPVEYRIVRPDGEIRHLRTALAVAEVRDGAPYRFVGLVEDLTDGMRARRAIAAHMAVARARTAWASFDQTARDVLAGLAGALECQGGIVWVAGEGQLVARSVWPDGTAGLLDPVRPGSRLRRAGAPAMRARTRRQAIGARSAVAIPVIAGAEVLAVVDLRSAERLALTDPLMRSLTGIGYELGQLLDDHRHELDMPLVTPREIEVLALAAQGLSAPQIGERLVISASTVRTHLENLYPKLGASDRAAAVAAALRLRLID